MSSISIADASRQLSQVINRASYGREVVILTSRGRPKAVLIGLDAFQQILGMEGKTELASVKEIRQTFRQALEEAGYRSPEDIVAFVRSVKKEMAEEILPIEEALPLENTDPTNKILPEEEKRSKAGNKEEV